MTRRIQMVEVTRFELATPSSRTMCATKLRYTSMKTAPNDSRLRWLRNRDSNPNKQSQSLSCYRYTIPQFVLHLEGGSGLIKQHDIRLHAKGSCDSNPLLLAAGELAGIAEGLILKSYFLKHFFGAL